MSDYMTSTSVPTPASAYAAWVSPTSTCATGAVFGMSKWTAKLAIAPNAAVAAAHRKHGGGARAFRSPV